ncbi:2OG-Fe(II) oxygenase [Marinobacter bryozoorum]|uniref:2OG-Fe(II) oxygenase n=1 Tax=Marinobacter bryozoorum TaxID=256324 RepID=UPI002006A00D|nr:2OG-Fe(II) oxygenase [Marinobacter bryozoorum]MCK7544725.1 2OG-Fe(II) oxygenase [Marinobacter bryozoorum]
MTTAVANVLNPAPVAAEPGLPQADESWLDAIATNLTEWGWLNLDASNRLGPALLAQLREEVEILEKTASMEHAGVGRGTDFTRDRSVRRDRIAWLNGQTPAQQQFFDFLEQVRVGLNQRLFLGLQRFESHYASYQPGDFYRRHLDSFRGRASRVVSMVLYLNEGWLVEDGGELQVFNRENPVEVCGRVLPDAGRVAIFMSEEVPHEVLPAARTRHSIACWFRQDVVPVPLQVG